MFVHRLLSLATGLAVSGATVQAQQQALVFPTDLGLSTQFGGWKMPAPFEAAPSRMQQIMAGIQIAKTSASIHEIALRPASYGRPVGGLTVQNLLVELGHAATTPEQMSTSYNANRGAGMTTVLSGRFALPSIPANHRPGDFSIVFPLSAPFAYSPSQGGLLLDIRNQDTYSYGGWRYELDSLKDAAAEKIPYGSCGELGPGLGCAVFEVQRLRAGPTLGQTVEFQTLNLPAALPGMVILGFSRLTWNGQSLPLDLGFMGATTGSKLWQSVDALLPMTPYFRQQSPYANRHAARLTLTVPNQPNLAGTEIFAQSVTAAAAGGSIATSNSFLMRIGRRLPVIQQLFSPWTSGNGHYFSGSRGGGGQYMFGGSVLRMRGTFN